jgi:hypothetical protein
MIIFIFLLSAIAIYLFFVVTAAKMFKRKEKYESEELQKPIRFDP